MRVSDYSLAVHELIVHGMSVDDAMTGLSRVLTARGHERLYPKILKHLERLTTEHRARDTGTVTVARSEDAAVLKEHIDRALGTLGVTESVTRVDPTISGGFIVSQTERRIDHSYKKRLLTLYRALIASH